MGAATTAQRAVWTTRTAWAVANGGWCRSRASASRAPPEPIIDEVHAALEGGELTIDEMLEVVLHFAVYCGWPKASNLEMYVRQTWARMQEERGEEPTPLPVRPTDVTELGLNVRRTPSVEERIQHMIMSIVRHPLRAKYADEWPELSAEFTTATHAEPGNICFDWFRSVEDPNIYLLVEMFRDRAAGDAHVNSDHFTAAMGQIGTRTPACPRSYMSRCPGRVGRRWQRCRTRPRRMTMRLGAVFPQGQFRSVDPDAVVRLVQRLEDAGYDHLLVYDHVLGADIEQPPGLDRLYNSDDPFLEPLVLFAYLAARAPSSS